MKKRKLLRCAIEKTRYIVPINFLFCTILIISCGREEKRVGKNAEFERSLEMSALIPQKDWIGKKMDIHLFSCFDRLICPKPQLDIKKSTLKIIYYFNGECSSCITKLAEWHNSLSKAKKVNENINCTYISFGLDADILQYYLDEMNIKLNYCLLHDKNGLFKERHDFIKQLYTYVFLIDEQNRIVAFGNPFYAENVMTIYKKYKIFDTIP